MMIAEVCALFLTFNDVVQWSSMQVAIAEAGGIRALVTLARDGTEMQRENATCALVNLARNDANTVCTHACMHLRARRGHSFE